MKRKLFATLMTASLMFGWYLFYPTEAWYLPGSYSGGYSGYSNYSYQNQYQNYYPQQNYGGYGYGSGYGGYGYNPMMGNVYTGVSPYVQLGSYGNIGGYYGGFI